VVNVKFNGILESEAVHFGTLEILELQEKSICAVISALSLLLS